MCDYCEHPVIYDYPGWGYYFTETGELVRFHNECINICENVVVAL